MDFQTLLKRFHDRGVEFVVIGGYASMLLGSDILTQDLDVCVRLGKQNLNRIYDAIEDLNPRNRMHPDKLRISRETATSDSIKILYFDGLIITKSAMNREKDRLTVSKLKAIREYLNTQDTNPD